MLGIKTIHNFLFYCGTDKNEFKAVKKDIYISNYSVWRILLSFTTVVFGILFVLSLVTDLFKINDSAYLFAFVYSFTALFLFLFLNKDSLFGQFIIYISVAMLLLFSGFISRNNSEVPATTFIVLLLITPMFVIDRPFFMAIEICVASAVFLIWMHEKKPGNIWMIDFVNVFIFTVVSVFLNMFADSVRIKEFILTRRINIQKDMDDLTGLKNKGALTREISSYLAEETAEKGIMFMMDIDRFKAINDTYGHDVGDNVIVQLGKILGRKFCKDEITGRFGGDEFIVFIKGSGDAETARKTADEIISEVAANVTLPDAGEKISISMGVAVYNGQEKDYSELFKKVDTALYKSKADPENRFYLFG